MTPRDDDRELRNDKGQTCAACGEHFKYQYLYDDHYPCRGARPLDPTTAAIEAQTIVLRDLRAENERLRRVVAAAKGYDEAVREIRDHFVKTGQAEVVREIEKIWLTEKQS